MGYPKVERIFVGIHAGMLGGIAMTAILIIVSLVSDDPWWSYLNLLSVIFYGGGAISAGPGWATASGAALQLAIAALGGALFVLVTGNVGIPRLGLYGVAWGVVLFYLSDWVYNAVSPLIDIYLPRATVLVSYVVYGAALAAVARRRLPLERLRREASAAVGVARGDGPEVRT
jgi:hypothetical protein